jgi:hypothetical protein
MATKKKGAKASRRNKLDIGSDPPVLVGGGGSSFIWVNTNQGQTMINPNSVPATAPTPHTKSDYSLSKIINGPVRLYFNNGVTPGPAGEVPLQIPPGAPRDQWYIRFARPGEALRRKKANKK